MPLISLVVCLYRERDMLERLIANSKDCYDDLVVVHDGPDTDNVREVVEKAAGRFFIGDKLEYQQEPHWPFAWGQAKHDWILRLDADEFPSGEMKVWLQEFRRAAEPSPEISGYTCYWPLWNGHRAVSKRWPAGRIFLFNRQKVKFFGMVEQVPVPDGTCQPLELALRHQPVRKSYGLHNVLVRKQAHFWRKCIVISLFGKPTDLPCWRWDSGEWPLGWEQMRRQPLSTAFKRITMGSLRALRDQWRAEKKIFPSAALTAPIHHALICIKIWRTKKFKSKKSETC